MRIQLSALADSGFTTGILPLAPIKPSSLCAANDNNRAVKHYRQPLAAERTDKADLVRLALHSFLFSFVFNAVLILPV
jgi:hypothetical protein